jgi:1,4-alpha-glucan branching enzyme
LALKGANILQESDHNPSGYLGFLLHAHLPFVRNTAPEFCLEEKWLFEALTESYLPLLLGWEQLAREQVAFHLTLSLSPTLISMLVDEALPERYGRYLQRLHELALREVERTFADPELGPVTRFYYHRIVLIEKTFNSTYQGNLILSLQKLAASGHLELITTCATHGYLPLIRSEEARRAQIRVGVQLFREVLGLNPTGLWLPECGYVPGVEKLLKAESLQYFIMSGHGFVNSRPRLESSVYVPARTGGIAVFGRDFETSSQVWSRTEGYPGDYYYREFYRDIGYDLDYDYLAPYLVAGRRSDTGFKYYRITGKTEHKAVYDLKMARLKIEEHARDFVTNRNRQIKHWAGQLTTKPFITAPYDAELFGHWWFEGPDWLCEVLRLTAAPACPVKTIGFTAYLQQYPPDRQVAFAHSSWGEGGYSRHWLNPQNDWVYLYYHRAEKLMTQLATTIKKPTPLQTLALNQAGRELLLAQSSDWSFILTSQTMVRYARERLHNHLTNFFQICHALKQNNNDAAALAQLARDDRIFPQLDYRVYRPEQSRFTAALKTIRPGEPVIVMLSWEFPPHYVGGLGIHVRDLAVELKRLGWNVQVLTAAADQTVIFENFHGVGVHYIPTCQSLDAGTDFLARVLRLNLALADYGREFLSYLTGPVLVHAHDWMVAGAARELQSTFRTRLVTTIHATEAGRNKGLHTPLQYAIDQIETELIRRSDRLICCSRYMQNELRNRYVPDREEPVVIANGVRPVKLGKREIVNQTIFYVGRLVIEKGVQYLLGAIPGLLEWFSQIKLVIAGNGPYEPELRQLAGALRLGKHVEFVGFVAEAERNRLLAESQVAVFPSLYEPFGIVALEAMAVGVPVVVSRTGGLAEIVADEVVGLSFQPGDVAQLQRCLWRILKNPEWAADLSRRAREMVELEYTWQAVARRTGRVYRQELAGGADGWGQ